MLGSETWGYRAGEQMKSDSIAQQALEIAAGLRTRMLSSTALELLRQRAIVQPSNSAPGGGRGTGWNWLGGLEPPAKYRTTLAEIREESLLSRI